MGRDLGVGVPRQSVDTSAAGARQRGALTLGAKACVHVPDRLAGPCPTGHERIIPRGHGGVAARLQVSQLAQLTDDALQEKYSAGGGGSPTTWS
jgi:hypothetical protein